MEIAITGRGMKNLVGYEKIRNGAFIDSV